MSHDNDVYVHNDGMTNLFLGAMAWSAWSRNEREAEAHERAMRKEEQIENQVYKVAKHILALPTSQVSVPDRIRAQVIVEDYEAELARQAEEERISATCLSVILGIIVVAVVLVAFCSVSSRSAQQPPQPVSYTQDAVLPASTPSPTPTTVRRAQLINAHPHRQG